jgi:purine-binding chemotaxis protein CheW
MAEMTADQAEQETERTQSYVIFHLGGEGYALEVARVQEVIDLTQMTQVPGGPKHLRGVINLRGHVVPVYDLRLPFELAVDPNPHRAPCVLIVETMVANEIRVNGLLVDRVSDVLDFTPEEIQPAPPLGLGKASPFVRGLIRHQEGFLLVLDVDRVITGLIVPSAGGGI